MHDFPRPSPSQVSRRVFLADMGRGVLAIAVFGVAGCKLGDPPSEQQSATPRAPAWQRIPVDGGFVSAYLLARSGEVAVVDTPGPWGEVVGGEDDILAALEAAGLGWTNVAHVVLTHKHADHAGGAAAVLQAAANARGYAGVEDIPFIEVPRPLTPVADGDSVLGVLIAGDALTTNDGRPTSPPLGSSEDISEALRSVAKLGMLNFETLLVGHGEPIGPGAAALVGEFLDRCVLDGEQETPTGAACLHPIDVRPP
jgi:glyoxylase-like metal-dependent hydrolase (beta-lactamase superfamily II)